MDKQQKEDKEFLIAVRSPVEMNCSSDGDCIEKCIIQQDNGVVRVCDDLGFQKGKKAILNDKKNTYL